MKKDGEKNKVICSQKHNVKRNKTIKTIIHIIVLIILSRLIGMWPMSKMPSMIEALVWAAYCGQLLILTNRLFGIKLPFLISAITLLGRIGLHHSHLKNEQKPEGYNKKNDLK